MYKYIENSINELVRKEIIVYGAGVFGRRCINLLKSYNIMPVACSDSNPAKWGTLFCGIKVIPVSELINIENVLVIVAIENFYTPFKTLADAGYNTSFFYNQKIYTPVLVSSWGDKTKLDIYEILHKKGIVLWGNEKQVRDVAYIFDDLQIKDSYSSLPNITDEDEFIVICDRYNDYYLNAMRKSCRSLGENYAFIEDVVPLLDEDNKIYGKIPSIMFIQTLFDSMSNQIKCIQPFNRMQLSSDFSVHCCCGDWADDWGNLQNNTMEEIWKSSIAKIFRLSILNRTYSFCKKERCVHMKINPEDTTERIIPEYEVTNVPEYIEVGIDKTCNLFCESCRNNILVETGKKHKQTLEIAKKIQNSGWLEKTKMLLLGGQGEVFVSQVYSALMYDVESQRKCLDLRTNGTAFSEEDMYRLVDKYEHLRIIVSIDAAKEETYNVLRRSNSKETYKKLLRNMDVLSKMRARKEIDFLQINMCVQMKNYQEIPDFVKWGSALGCDAIYFTPIRNWGTYTEEEFKKIGIFIKDKEVKPEVLEVINKIKGKQHVQIAF